MTAPVRVLIVEDEESYVDALQLGLGREGFSTTSPGAGRRP